MEGSLDLSGMFRDSLDKAISRCRDSRWQIAAKVCALCRRTVSKAMLDKHEQQPRLWPAGRAPAGTRYGRIEQISVSAGNLARLALSLHSAMNQFRL
ncbi:MAG: hypothetical protein MZV70_13885 [Desulfobacterales bacterium]|nr:hypothetical protein [Desulfobacterales bacterium]